MGLRFHPVALNGGFVQYRADSTGIKKGRAPDRRPVPLRNAMAGTRRAGSSRVTTEGSMNVAQETIETVDRAEPISISPLEPEPAKRQGRTTRSPLRIAQVAGPFEPVPPRGYGGTERVIDALVRELIDRGHEVTTYASGDSDVLGRLVATVPEALRPAGFDEDGSGYLLETAMRVLDDASEFDLIHSHVEWSSLWLSRATTTPTAYTFHGRLDRPWTSGLLERTHGSLVAISEHQASTHPDVDWAAVVHNGLDLSSLPWRRESGPDLCFVGRVAPEKGVIDAIQVAARAGRHLRIAAKVGPLPEEQDYFENVFKPALKGNDVEFLGELSDDDRGKLVSESLASLITGVWPEPFGLVVIESLAAGTPVLGRRVGALPEIIREGVDGFFGDDPEHLAFFVDRVETLDRKAIRESVVDRFSAKRMADSYEDVYVRAIERAHATR
jgi:glycosyltransferase involved in cell wall biosynthesis